MSNLNPYEIRTEILKMAKELLMEEYYATKERLIVDWSMRCEHANVKGEVPPDHPALPPFPTENDIIKKAQILNGFVSNVSEQTAAKSVRKS